MWTKAMAGAVGVVIAAALAVQIASAAVSILMEAVAFGGLTLIFTGLLRQKDRRIAELRDTNAGLLRDNLDMARLLSGDDRQRVEVRRG